MGIRVTEHQVQIIIGIESGIDMSLFIEVASRLVDEILATSSLSSKRLADVELYLAAHLAALTEEGGGVTMQRAGASSVQYAQLQGNNLSLTRFGQMALSLDTTGKLAASTKEKARFSVFGPKTALNS